MSPEPEDGRSFRRGDGVGGKYYYRNYLVLLVILLVGTSPDPFPCQPRVGETATPNRVVPVTIDSAQAGTKTNHGLLLLVVNTPAQVHGTLPAARASR